MINQTRDTPKVKNVQYLESSMSPILVELESADEIFFFFGGRETGEPGEKTSEQGENREQTQLTHNRIRATLLGGECIPAGNFPAGNIPVPRKP